MRTAVLLLTVLFSCGISVSAWADETVATIGHNLKGTAHSYGFSRLGELGAALEEAANANQVQRIASLVDRFEHWIGEARRTGESRSEMKRPASGRTGRVPIRHR